MRTVVIAVWCVAAAVLGLAAQGRTGTLTIYNIDTAGVAKIDHLWTTYDHGDHVGTLLELAKQLPSGAFARSIPAISPATASST